MAAALDPVQCQSGLPWLRPANHLAQHAGWQLPGNNLHIRDPQQCLLLPVLHMEMGRIMVPIIHQNLYPVEFRD